MKCILLDVIHCWISFLKGRWTRLLNIRFDSCELLALSACFLSSEYSTDMLFCGTVTWNLEFIIKLFMQITFLNVYLPYANSKIHQILISISVLQKILLQLKKLHIYSLKSKQTKICKEWKSNGGVIKINSISPHSFSPIEWNPAENTMRPS